MSISPSKVSCDGCSFESYVAHSPVTVIYQLPDNSKVTLGRAFGWCPTCDTVVNIESLPSVNSLQVEISRLEKAIHDRAWSVSGLVNKMLGGGKSDDHEQLIELQGQLRLLTMRKGRPRCLKCGCDNVGLLSRNPSGDYKPAIHSCGGKLSLRSGSDNSPRFNYRQESIYLDLEGNRLSK